MNMVEKVARAMAAADSGPEGSALFDIHWREFGNGYTSSARVAIETMLPPTREMIVDGRIPTRKISNMIEKVARAISASHYPDKDADVMWRHMVPDARAAIEAMREPTVEIEIAGTEQWLCEAAMEDRSRANWQAMIDASLNENGGDE